MKPVERIPHYEEIQEIISKVVNETFFGLMCLVMVILALWVLPANSFIRSCAIGVALFTGGWFYLVSIVKVLRKKMHHRSSKLLWAAGVICVPVLGGLIFYYWRLRNHFF
jgi:hypothetical protein